MITADHGQSARGHHGGAGDVMPDVAFYYFGSAGGAPEDRLLDQKAIAPSVLNRLAVAGPAGMREPTFLDGD